MQAKAVVDALVQDAAEPRIALENQHVARAGLHGGFRRGKPCRAAADNNNVAFHCTAPPFSVLPQTISEPLPFLRTAVTGTPSSRARISMTRGEQKPA